MTSEDPPIATATVAWLYMEQGKLDQAEQLYRRLLAEDPTDARLERGLAEVERRRQIMLAPQPGERLTLDRRGEKLRCCYQVSDEGHGRARLVLGRPGTLVLRLVAFPIAPEAPPLDIPLDATAGDIEVDPPERARVVGAAVGLRSEGGDFVSIAHAGPVSVRP